MKAFKLLRLRPNGTLGSLFINRRAELPVGQWMEAQPYKTKGYAFRPGWHCMPQPHAPHLSTKGRAWFTVEIEDVTVFNRPASQGGQWLLAGRMRIVRSVENRTYTAFELPNVLPPANLG